MPRLRTLFMVLVLPPALALAAALPGCQHEITRTEVYNLWKQRCYQLSDRYQKILEKAPYHPMADRDANRCSTPDPEFQWDGSQENMYILVANFFYHYDIEVRAKAFAMLEAYHCERDKRCQDLARVLDLHIAGSLSIQTTEWKTRFHQRARDFHRYLLTKP